MQQQKKKLDWNNTIDFKLCPGWQMSWERIFRNFLCATIFSPNFGDIFLKSLLTTDFVSAAKLEQRGLRGSMQYKGKFAKISRQKYPPHCCFYIYFHSPLFGVIECIFIGFDSGGWIVYKYDCNINIQRKMSYSILFTRKASELCLKKC